MGPRLTREAAAAQEAMVDRFYIDSLGLDPDDADREALGWDWIRPRQAEARARRVGKLLGISAARGRLSAG